MTAEDERGWWEVPPATEWTCPECGVASPVKDWAERRAYCEDCGDHDGRECPACEEVLDHVWGATKIAEASGLPSAPGWRERP
jgi:hypothetical protein